MNAAPYWLRSARMLAAWLVVFGVVALAASVVFGSGCAWSGAGLLAAAWGLATFAGLLRLEELLEQLIADRRRDERQNDDERQTAISSRR